jgi:hypothetical protein
MRSDQSFAAVITSIGVVGEAAILWHALVHTYPFKVFTYPPPQFFERLAHLLAVAVSVIFVAIAFWMARRISWATPPIVTFLAPLVFAAGVAAITVVRYGTEVPAGFRNFDDYTIGQALRELGSDAFSLSVSGLVVGSLCSLIVVVLRRRRAVVA